MRNNINCHWTYASFSFLNIQDDAHRAVMILWANITALLAPVDLKGATAADLTHSLMGSLVHTCSKPDVTWMDIQASLLQLPTLQHSICVITWPTRRAGSGSGLQRFWSSRTHLTLMASSGAVQDIELKFIMVKIQTFFALLGCIKSKLKLWNIWRVDFKGIKPK